MIQAFLPVSRSFVTKEVGTTLRRSRILKSGDAGIALVETLQRETGLYRDFRYGAFLQATVERTAELPSVFPLEGKNPADAPPRMRFTRPAYCLAWYKSVTRRLRRARREKSEKSRRTDSI